MLLFGPLWEAAQSGVHGESLCNVLKDGCNTESHTEEPESRVATFLAHRPLLFADQGAHVEKKRALDGETRSVHGVLRNDQRHDEMTLGPLLATN